MKKTSQLGESHSNGGEKEAIISVVTRLVAVGFLQHLLASRYLFPEQLPALGLLTVQTSAGWAASVYAGSLPISSIIR